jgi:hypothetical protein
MSTTQDHGNFVFQCDGSGCRDFIDTNTSNFEAARNLLRRAGWRPIRRGDDWSHVCAGCQARRAS